MAHIVFLLVIDDEMAADSGMKRWYGAVEFSPWVKSWWCSSTVMSDSATPWTVAPQLLCPWDSPGQNTGVGCHFFLQGIFLTQGSNLNLLCLLT